MAAIAAHKRRPDPGVLAVAPFERVVLAGALADALDVEALLEPIEAVLLGIELVTRYAELKNDRGSDAGPGPSGKNEPVVTRDLDDELDAVLLTNVCACPPAANAISEIPLSRMSSFRDPQDTLTSRDTRSTQQRDVERDWARSEVEK